MGVARLALQARVPVIPVAMIGTDKVQPIGKRVPNIRRIGMIFGEPLDFSRYYGMEDDRLIQRSVTDEIMYELMRLSGQEYVDEYAAVVKLRMAGKAQDAGKDAALEKAQEAVPDTAQDATSATPAAAPEQGAPTAAGEDGPEVPGTA